MRCLILARDRIGEKPLYFGYQGNGDNKVLLFGSELKGLNHPEFKRQIDRNSNFSPCHNCIPAPYSIYKDIYKLQPGHYLKLEEKDLKKYLLPKSKSYWCLIKTAIDGNKNQLKQSEKDIQKNLKIQLRSIHKKTNDFRCFIRSFSLRRNRLINNCIFNSIPNLIIQLRLLQLGLMKVIIVKQNMLKNSKPSRYRSYRTLCFSKKSFRRNTKTSRNL